MPKALTARSVESASPDPCKRREIPDGLLTGLYLVIQPSGIKSWAVRYRSPASGKPAKFTLGRYPALALAEARAAAGAALRAVATGRDPADEKAAAKAKAADQSDLCAVLLDDFVRRHIETRNKPSTANEHKRLVERVLKPAWGSRKVETIRKRDVIALLDSIRDRGAEITANRVLALARVWFNWMLARGVVETSPVAGVKAPTPERSRDRVLSDLEVRLLWEACDRNGHPWGAFARLLLLTAQRREEVAAMTWTELDLDAGLWRMERSRTKNGQPHTVPLVPTVVDILRTVPHLDASPYVFPAARLRRKGSDGDQPTLGHIRGFSKGKDALDRAMHAIARESDLCATVEPWRFHDLRRTAASTMARLGQPVHVVEAILNHRTGAVSGVAAIYNRYEYADEKRRALDALANFVAEIVGAPGESNVVLMRGRS